MSVRSSNSFNSALTKGKSTGTIPKLPEIKIVTSGGQAYPNPFYVPTDEEIFKAKGKQIESKRQEKIRISQLKIWEKGLKNHNEGNLRKISEIEQAVEAEIDDEDKEENARMNIVEAAKNAIKNRIIQRESLPSFIHKKREMFLFQMMINQKKEQIKEFEELAHLQEIGLQKSEMMIEEDLDSFNKFLEENKNKCRMAIKLAEDETKRKQEKIQEIKHLQEQKSSLMSKYTKFVEKLEELYKSKVFLDDLTAPEFLERQKQLKEQRKKMNTIMEDDKNSTKFPLEMYNIVVSKSLLDLIEDSDDEFDMYFQKPEQLHEIFENLEEKNLFLIKYTQETEQAIEEYQSRYNTKKLEFTQKKNQLMNTKLELEREIQVLTKHINNFIHVRNDNFSQNILEELQANIKETYKMIGLDPKLENKLSGYDMLKEMEKKADEQINELQSFDSSRVIFYQKKHIKERKEEQKKINEEIEKQEQKKKAENLKKRMMATKRVGRTIMAKTNLEKKQDKVEKKPQINEEEEDRKKYFTLRNY